MDSLILQLQAQYKKLIPAIACDVPGVAAAPPETPIRNKPLISVPLRSKRKHSEEHIAAAPSSSPGRIIRGSTKRKRTEERDVCE